MCNHEYIGRYAIGTSEKCTWPEIFMRWGKTGNCIQLPIDHEGKCIFHSKDKAFKWSNEFIDCLCRLLSQGNQDNELNELDCREFLIVGEIIISEQLTGIPADKINLYGDYYHFQLKDFVCTKPLDLRFTVFSDKFHVTGCTFQKNVDITHGVFCTQLDVEECVFESGLNIDQVSAKQLYLSNSYFGDALYANSIKINNSLSISACAFAQSFSMIRAEITGEIATIEYTQFQGVTFFDDSRFLCISSFNNSNFAAETSLQRMEFKDMVFFNEITISNTLLISGRSKTERCFDGQVEFQPASLTGFVRLENVNFFHFDKKSRIGFEELQANRLAELGPGCLNYTCSIVFEVNMIKEVHYFVEEIAHTFGFYFQLLQGIHLGININRISDQQLKVVYYTDEPLAQNVFEAKIQTAQKQLLAMAQSSKPDTDDIIRRAAPAMIDASLKTKFNFIRAGIAANAYKIPDFRVFINELFKPIDIFTQADDNLFPMLTEKETKQVFPLFHVDFHMDNYNISGGIFNGPTQIGSKNQQHIAAQAVIHEALKGLQEQVDDLFKDSENKKVIITEIIKEIDEQATKNSKVEKSTFEKLKLYLDTGASFAKIADFLITIGKYLV